MKTTFTACSKTLHHVLLIFIWFAVVPANAQRSYTSIGIKTIASGNGLAAAPALAFSFTSKNVEIELGANCQLRNTHLSGVQGIICWYAGKPGRKMRLGFFAGGRYLFASTMKRNLILQEKFVAPESSLDFDALQLRTLEEQIGFGLRLQHTLCFSSFYGIGIGAYQTLGDTSPYRVMHREINGTELVLNFGVRYSFIRKQEV